MTDFSGKRILVLGGSRGIGADMVRRFAADGGDVLFTFAGSTEAAGALARETGSEAVRVDSADREGLLQFIRERGPFHVAIINAGIYVGGDPLAIDAAAIDRIIDVNIRAPYFAAVEAARAMSSGGRIILIGSTNADRTPFTGSAAYSMTKAAMQGLVRGLARDFGPREITVNVVQPGPTNTDMNPSDGPMRDLMHGFMAIKRHVDGKEVAALTAYLAGPEASMITGAMHTIDGGFAA